MKNYIQPGMNIDVVAPAGGSVSGEALLIGASLFGVAFATKAVGEDLALGVEGVYELPKLTTDVMAVGAKVNWNSTNDELQLATSNLDNCATVLEAAGNGILVVKVKITPV